MIKIEDLMRWMPDFKVDYYKWDFIVSKGGYSAIYEDFGDSIHKNQVSEIRRAINRRIRDEGRPRIR